MLITAGCGRGKTHYALSLSPTGLLAAINEKRRFINLLDRNLKDIEPSEVLFLTSRKVIKSQQLKSNDNCVAAIPADFADDADLKNDFIEEKEKEKRKGKIRITTAHNFGELVKKGLVKRQPKVIIVDEIHSVFSETIFAESLIFTIEYLKEHYDSIIKIGLTATPEFLTDYIEKNDKELHFKIIDIDLGSKYKSKEIKVIKNGSIDTYLRECHPASDSKYIVYTQSAKKCYELSQQYGSKSAFLISDYNERKVNDRLLVDIMNEQGVKQYIIENQKLPDDIDIVFLNSACREGMNLKDKNIKHIICEAPDMLTIEQIYGRMRGDTDTMTVICNFHNFSKIKNDIDELNKLYAELEKAEDKQVVLAHRHGEQEQNKYLQKYVYQYKDKYRLNNYAKCYLQYMRDCYQQIGNYDGNFVKKIDTYQLDLCQDYIKKLQKYAVNGIITLDSVIKVSVEKNHENVIQNFRNIEYRYLDKPLTQKEKEELVEYLKPVRDNHKPATWQTLKKIFTDNGYIVKDKLKSVNGKQIRVSIIKDMI